MKISLTYMRCTPFVAPNNSKLQREREPQPAAVRETSGFNHPQPVFNFQIPDLSDR